MIPPATRCLVAIQDSGSQGRFDRPLRVMIEALERRLMFSRFSPAVTNPYFPLPPGASFTYAGRDEDGAALRVEMDVFAKPQVIHGVACTVARSREFVGGRLSEVTVEWYAQDEQGNVWYFGEDSSELEDDVIVSRSGSWQAGRDGAEPGIIMPARAAIGARFRQEVAPGIAEDQAEVIANRHRLATALGGFRDVVILAESSPLEPEVLEHKYFARGVGMVLAVGVSGEEETIELVEVDGSLVTRRPAAPDTRAAPAAGRFGLLIEPGDVHEEFTVSFTGG